EVDYIAPFGLCAFRQSPRDRQLVSRWVIALSLALILICGCANIGSFPPITSLSRLTKNLPVLPHIKRPSPPPSVEQLKTMTPFAIAAGPDGNLWFSELRSSAIGRITLAAEISSFELGSGSLAVRLTAGPDGAIWFTDPAVNRIGRLALDGTTAYVPLPTPESRRAGLVRASD